MKKTKYISLIILLLSFGTIFSQSKNRILTDLSKLLEHNNINPELYYNAEDKILDIDGYQINLMFSKPRFEESDGPSLGFVCHSCPDSFSTYHSETKTYYNDIGFPMKDKESVYKAIKLVNELKDIY